MNASATSAATSSTSSTLKERPFSISGKRLKSLPRANLEQQKNETRPKQTQSRICATSSVNNDLRSRKR